jgi:hypothetical protein
LFLVSSGRLVGEPTREDGLDVMTLLHMFSADRGHADGEATDLVISGDIL